MPTKKIIAARRLGNTNGYSARNLLFPNNAGILSTGFVKNPPKLGPMIDQYSDQLKVNRT